MDLFVIEDACIVTSSATTAALKRLESERVPILSSVGPEVSLLPNALPDLPIELPISKPTYGESYAAALDRQELVMSGGNDDECYIGGSPPAYGHGNLASGSVPQSSTPLERSSGAGIGFPPGKRGFDAVQCLDSDDLVHMKSVRTSDVRVPYNAAGSAYAVVDASSLPDTGESVSVAVDRSPQKGRPSNGAAIAKQRIAAGRKASFTGLASLLRRIAAGPDVEALPAIAPEHFVQVGHSYVPRSIAIFAAPCCFALLHR